MLNFDEMPRFKSQAFQIIRMVPVWAKAFDVGEGAIIKQIPISHAWCDSNKRKAPKKDMVRFIFNWLTHAQKFGNLVMNQPDRTYHDPVVEYVGDMTFEELVAIRKKNFGQLKGDL